MYIRGERYSASGFLVPEPKFWRNQFERAGSTLKEESSLFFAAARGSSRGIETFLCSGD